jgi:antitoxin component YwqK of YwqJK toxin-antitoxin module
MKSLPIFFILTVLSVSSYTQEFKEEKLYYNNGKIKEEGLLQMGQRTGTWIFYTPEGIKSAEIDYYKDMLHGLNKVYYDDGKTVMEEYNYWANQRHSWFAEYYENSLPRLKGFYHSNQKDSIWQYFYEDGKLKSEVKYKKGILEGIISFYTPKGEQTVKNGFGYIVNYHDNNMKKSEGKVENGLEHGLWTYYFPNGKKSSEGHYINGERTGTWYEWYENGNLKSEINTQSGMNIYYTYDGKKEMEGKMIDGKREETWTYWYPSGQIRSINNYKEDLRHGVQIKYYENGNKQSEIYFENGKREGPAYFWFEDGKKDIEGNFKNDLQNGLWTYWRTDGQKGNEGYFVDGKMHGIWTYWYGNGQIWKEAEYNMGVKHGKWIIYYENGNLFRKGQFENDKEIGLWKEWYDDGQLKLEGNFENGIMTGKWTGYHENGVKKSLIEYKNGLINGKSYFWFPNGKPQTFENYKIIVRESKDTPDKILIETSVLHGKYQVFNIKGIEVISGEYFQNLRNGKFVYRNENGGIIREETYKMDKPDGVWKTYYDFGRLESEVNYKNGVKEGKATYYDHRGNITFQAIYKAGRQTDILFDSSVKQGDNNPVRK